MKNLKKKLAGILIFAMVLGIMAPGMTTTVQAAEVQIGAVADYDNEVINVTFPASMSAVYFSDTKVDLSKVDMETVEKADPAWKATWERVEFDENATGAAIDLSWVKKNKPANIIVRFVDGETETFKKVVTPAQETKLKVGLSATSASSVSSKKVNLNDMTEEKYVGTAETGFLYFYIDKTTEAISTSAIEWRKGTTGKWAPVDGDDNTKPLDELLPMFKAKGATLYFRTVADDNAWASKEVKFSYKKQANAPKVKVDVSKYTLSVKTGMEYRVEGVAKWEEVPANTKVINVLELFKLDSVSKESITAEGTLYAGEKLTVEVRTAANKEKGTMPSKITEVVLECVSPSSIEEVVNVGVATQSGLVVNNYLPYQAKSGVTFKNYETDTEYEYMLVAATPAAVDGKWTKIGKAKNAETAKKVDVKENKIGTAKFIAIRAVGDKKAGAYGKLAGEIFYVEYDKIGMIYSNVKDNGVSFNGTKNWTATIENNEAVSAQAISVSGSAVTGAGVSVTMDIEMENLTTAKAECKVTNNVDGLTVTVENSGKAKENVVTVSLKGAENKDYAGTFVLEIEGVKITVTVDIAKDTTN